jgi:DNA polymerase III subunit delta
MTWLQDYFKELERVRAGKIKPAYLLFGSDYYLASTFIQEVRKILSGQGVDRQHVTAKELRVNNLQQLLYGTSLFQSRNFIIIEEIKQMIPTVRKAFLKYLENPSESNILILTAPVIERRHDFLSKVAKKVQTLYVNPPFDKEIPQWAVEYLKKKERLANRDAIMTLIRMTGNDLNDLANELDKLDLMLPPGERITVQSVMKSAGYQRTWTPDDLNDSIGEKDRKKAVEIAENLIEHGVSEVFIYTTLFHYLWNLRILRDPRVEDGPTLTRTWKRNKYEKHLQASKRFTNADLARGVKAVLLADTELKSVSGDSLTRLILTLDKILE